MVFSLVETHCHLDMEQFDTDRADAISRAKTAGVEKMITIGIDINSSCRAIRLAHENEGIFATVGIHPHEIQTVTPRALAEIEKLAVSNKVVAIGEIGLDYHYHPVDESAQISLLKQQLKIAEKLGLPVVIHSRDADDDTRGVLAEWTSARRTETDRLGVIHCFNGDLQAVTGYLEMGFYISLGAYIGYPSSKKSHDVIRAIPLERLLLETDSPFLPPQKYRGQRNEPAYIPFVLEALADITGLKIEDIASKTTQNAHYLFRLP